MGRKAVGPVCCVMHIREPSYNYRKEKGFAPKFLGCATAPCKPLNVLYKWVSQFKKHSSAYPVKKTKPIMSALIRPLGCDKVLYKNPMLLLLLLKTLFKP